MGASERVILLLLFLFLLAQYGIEVLLSCLGWHQNSSNKIQVFFIHSHKETL